MSRERAVGQQILLTLLSNYVSLGWHFLVLGHWFSWALSPCLCSLLYDFSCDLHNSNPQISISNPELKLRYQEHLDLNMWTFPRYG